MIITIVIIQFWKKICGNKKENDEEAEWIKRQEERTKKDTEQQEWEDIELEEVKCSPNKQQKQNSPGFDKLTNFWLNTLISTHKVLTQRLTQTMKNLE